MKGSERPILGDSRHSADLVIIGGGGSGLSAAVRARELGIQDVVVVEKTGRLGGNAWLAVVMLGLGDSGRLQPDMTDWRDRTFAALMQFGKWTHDAKLVRAFVEKYPEMVAWLQSKGMRFEGGGFDVAGRHDSIPLCLGSQTGDGLAMAEDIGLAMGEDMDPGIIGPGHHPWRHSIHETVLRPETLWINKNAGRFINETVSFMACPALIRQPGAVMYALLDSKIKDHIQANPTPRQIQMDGVGWFRTLDEDLQAEAGWNRNTVAIADTLGELAQKIGVDAEILQATVDRYNMLCEQGRDADFVKDPQFLMPLHTPPYYALLGVRFCHGTEGGVKVNERMEVTGRQGQLVEGLYATGDNTSGWVAEWALPGTTLAFAFTSGYIAAESAAARNTRPL